MVRRTALAHHRLAKNKGKMKYAVWKEEYSVKVTSVDVQHKQILDLLNELYDLMRREYTLNDLKIFF